MHHMVSFLIQLVIEYVKTSLHASSRWLTATVLLGYFLCFQSAIISTVWFIALQLIQVMVARLEICHQHHVNRSFPIF
jgi:hypothetical protein